MIGDYCANLYLHQITAAQLAVDCKVDQRAITQPTASVKEEADGPNLAKFQRAFRANFSASVPCLPDLCCWIVLGKSHDISPSATMALKENGLAAISWTSGAQADRQLVLRHEDAAGDVPMLGSTGTAY